MARSSSPLRVVVGVHGGAISGIDTYAEQLAVAAAEVATDVVLLATTPQAAASVRRRAGDRLRVVHLGLTPPTARRLLLFRLSPAAASRHMERALGPGLAALGYRPDILHLNHPPLATAAGGAARHVVVAGWFYPHSLLGRMGETWRHTGHGSPRSAALALKALAHYRNDVRGYGSADCIVTPTEQLALALRGRGLRARRMVPPARAAQPVNARVSHRDAVDERLRLVACCGDLGHPRKNIAAAVDVTAELARRGRAAVLTLVGRNANALEGRIHALPKGASVRVVGPLSPEGVAAALRAADVLLFPSLFEEWGYVAVESALAGTPVVTLPVYPFREMLAPPVGRTARDMTIAALADAVEDTLTDAVTRSVVAHDADERFGVETAGRRLGEIWDELLSEPPRPTG